MDGTFRVNLEETGMSCGMEFGIIRLAREKGLLTTPYVFCEDDASAMAEAGADIVGCHLGLTTGGSLGAETALKLEDCPPTVDAWAAAPRKETPDTLDCMHGGTLPTPTDATHYTKTQNPATPPHK